MSNYVEDFRIKTYCVYCQAIINVKWLYETKKERMVRYIRIDECSCNLPACYYFQIKKKAATFNGSSPFMDNVFFSLL